MKKKIIIGLVAVLIVASGVAGMSAFEAHVINVTAKIENALSVAVEEIKFGTVFPQEYLEEDIEIALSDSFMAEDNADDVEYVIKQKPKCWNNDPAAPIFGRVTEAGEDFVCEDPNFVMLPLLCEYLSKTDADPEDQNDGPNVPPFHSLDKVTLGRLAKSQNDTSDLWTIDLAVPCFEGHCSQDWADFVHANNPDADPDAYVLPIEAEHDLFGCDLWIEVTGISRVEGDENTVSVALENKDDDGWFVLVDDMMGTLTYVTAGPTFDYTFTAQGLVPDTDYSLIYYADPWAGNNPGALIGSGMTDSNGDMALAGSPDLGMDLPDSADANYPTGAKVWLVPSSDYDSTTNSMTAWNQTAYLFEYNLILYNDTDI